MKKLTIGLAGLGLMIVAVAAIAGPDGDRSAVHRAVLDYCEAFYEGKPEYLERSVHPELSKFGYYMREGKYHGVGMTFPQAIELSKEWNEDGTKANEKTVKDVQILDLLDKTACAKLTAKWGIDYLLLAKVEGAWKIRQVLWQTHPPARD